jgi:hypothetical protein
MMQRTWETWLLAACDPAPRATAPRRRLTPAELNAALGAAKRHFVLGSALQSVSAWRLSDDLRLAAVIQPWSEFQLRDAGRTLGLRVLAEQAVQALAGAGIPCCILKGLDFAKRLYPSPALRPFRDVDLLVPRDAYRDADQIIRSLGYKALGPERKYAADDYGQISYLARGAEQWSLELHWNLINSPSQRRRCSLAWEDLDFLSQPFAAANGHVHQLTPTSLLLLASVHACVGHRFDSLQQLCDIRQICRGAAGLVDPAGLSDASRRLQCETPLAWALDMVARIFNCRATRELIAQCQFSRNAARPLRLLGRHTVMRPYTAASKLRRSLARIRLKNAA